MKVILSHPTGNANVRATAKGFYKNNILDSFYTTIAIFPGSKLDRIGAIGPFSELRRRSFDPSLRSLTKTSPMREITRLTAGKLGLQSFIKHESGVFSIDEVYRGLDRRVASTLANAFRRGVKGVYAYEDGAAFTFSKAKLNNLQCFYDLPAGYWRTARRLLAIEQERWPQWTATMTGFKDSAAKLERKDEELRLADRIFVASHFTAQTLQDFPGPSLPPVEVIPYGFPPANFSRKYREIDLNAGPLKLLFVGKLTQQKGLADLLSAVESIGSYVELTLVGQKGSNNCPALDAALCRHNWIPTLSNEAVLKLMQENDVLVFPSLFDGFGLVITEAMAQGTPVIASDRCAGPDLIEHNKNGWLIEHSSSNAIKSAIEEILNNPHNVAKVGKEAMETAHRRPWEVYNRELYEAIKRHFDCLS